MFTYCILDYFSKGSIFYFFASEGKGKGKGSLFFISLLLRDASYADGAINNSTDLFDEAMKVVANGQPQILNLGCRFFH